MLSWKRLLDIVVRANTQYLEYSRVQMRNTALRYEFGNLEPWDCMRSLRKYMMTKKRNSPRIEPWGTSTCRGQRDQVTLLASKSKHSFGQRFLARTSQVLHMLFVARCKNNLLGNVHSDLGMIYLIRNLLFANSILLPRKKKKRNCFRRGGFRPIEKNLTRVFQPGCREAQALVYIKQKQISVCCFMSFKIHIPNCHIRIDHNGTFWSKIWRINSEFREFLWRPFTILIILDFDSGF